MSGVCAVGDGDYRLRVWEEDGGRWMFTRHERVLVRHARGDVEWSQCCAEGRLVQRHIRR